MIIMKRQRIGLFPDGFGSAFGDFPAIGAVVAHELGFSSQIPPLRFNSTQSIVHLGTWQERISGWDVTNRLKLVIPIKRDIACGISFARQL
jgi:hypothetical protein